MKLENTISYATRVCLEIFGIWPNSSCIFLRRIFWSAVRALMLIAQYQYIIMHMYNTEISKIMDFVSAAMTYSLFLLKLLIFWYKQRTFNRLLAMMASDWENSSSMKFNRIASTNNAKLSQRFATFTVFVFSIATLFYSTSTLMDTKRTINASITYPLIVKINLPFHYDKRFIYELIILIQFVDVWVCGCAIGLFDALLVNLILHVSAQIDILREWFRNILSRQDECDMILLIIRNMIRKHQKIIRFSEHIEDLYSNIAMVLFVSDTVIICCLGYTIVVSIDSPDAVNIILKTVLFYINMNMEVFIFCFAGEYLTAKSQSIGDAAYNSYWYKSYSKDINRSILFLIMRSQNKLTITIGKVTNLSLERFSSIVKASASYISVLLTIY